MKRVTCIVVGLMLSFAMSASAQTPAEKKGPQKIGLAAGLQNSYAIMKRQMTRSAVQMPAADYGFKPGSSPELKTFGQWVGHEADNLFMNCAQIKGIPNSNPDKTHENKTDKAALVKALADGFAFCDDAMSALTDQSVHELVRREDDEMARGAVVSIMHGHGVETNGILEIYLLAKGISPGGGSIRK